jgi:glycine/D-amino acid oxidase-like deaminating enzyme
METFEVGIVGAGVHGASAAFHLSSARVRVVIFDRGAPAGGPTGRSSAICRAYYTNRLLAEVAKDSMAMFRSFPEITAGRNAGFRQTGFLFLHPEEQVERLKSAARQLNELGTPIELFHHDQLPGAFPVINPEGVMMAAWEPGAGYADPVGTTQGLFERAVELGATPRLHTKVVHIAPRRGGGATLTTENGGAVECGRLLLAAGPWTSGLASMMGLSLPLTVERHIVVTLHWTQAKKLPFGHADLISGYYCRPEGEELFCVGPLEAAGQAAPDAFSPVVTDAESQLLAAAVLRRIPDMAEGGVHDGWASLYDVSPDWQPIIGEIADGVFVDAGTSGHGFKLAPALGSWSPHW